MLPTGAVGARARDKIERGAADRHPGEDGGCVGSVDDGECVQRVARRLRSDARPLMADDQAVANCTAMKAPDDRPAIELSVMAAFSAGSASRSAPMAGSATNAAAKTR